MSPRADCSFLRSHCDTQCGETLTHSLAEVAPQSRDKNALFEYILEPTMGVEPMTPFLPRKCSTSELRRLIKNDIAPACPVDCEAIVRGATQVLKDELYQNAGAKNIPLTEVCVENVRMIYWRPCHSEAWCNYRPSFAKATEGFASNL